MTTSASLLHPEAFLSPLAIADAVQRALDEDLGRAGDITAMAAQVPALFETLSGMPISELLGKVRQIGDKASKPDGKNGGSK